jgi:hypothetical protein
MAQSEGFTSLDIAYARIEFGLLAGNRAQPNDS